MDSLCGKTLTMSTKHWTTILIALVAGFAVGAYFGPDTGRGRKVAPGPTRFFSNFDPQQYLEAATEGKVTWKLLEDEPVTGEQYGNPPHSRAYARRTSRFAATIPPEQWQDVSQMVFSNQGDDVEQHGEDKGGGKWRDWSIPADSADNEATTRHGFGWRYYGGTRGVGSHHGLFTFRSIQVEDHVEVAFFIWESWPLND